MTTDHSLSRVASRLGVAGLVLALTCHAPLSARARAVPQAGSASVEPLRLGDFVLSFDARGLTGMAGARDRFGAQVLA